MRQLTFLLCFLSFSFSWGQDAYTTNENATTDATHSSLDSLLQGNLSGIDTLNDNSHYLEANYFIWHPDSCTYPAVESPEFTINIRNAGSTYHKQIQKIDSSIFHPKRPDKITYRITVLDTVSGANIPAQVFMSSISEDGKRYNGTGVTTSSGKFEFQVSEKSHFEINVNGMGYYTFAEVINVKNEDISDGVIERTYKLRPLKKGDVIRLNQINFAQGDYQLNKESLLQINRLIALLKANPEMVIQLEGHTESTASYKSSVALSEKRVFEVRYYMVRKGIDVKRIKAVGYGNTKPITTKKGEEAQLLNRRVEFRVLKM